MSELFIETDLIDTLPVVTVKGRIDSETAPELDQALEKLLNESKDKIILNLQNVEYMSSAGLRAMVKAYQAAQKTGGDVRLAAVSDPVGIVLRTVGMMQMLKMYPTNEAALESF